MRDGFSCTGGGRGALRGAPHPSPAATPSPASGRREVPATPPWRAWPFPGRRRSRASASALRRRPSRPSRRTRCAGRAARRDRRRCRRRPSPFRAALASALANAAWASAGKRRDRGIDHLQADAGVRARRGNAGEKIDPGRALRPNRRSPWRWRRRARMSALSAAERLRPLQRVDIVLDAQHRGRVDRLALEDAFDQLAALGHAEDLRQRPRPACRSPAARPRAG